jgi:hypothetical protein
MEYKPKNKLEDLSPEEMAKVAKMERLADEIKEYVLNMPVSVEWAWELNKLLDESYQEFIPELNSENLKSYCFDFVETLKSAEQKFVLVMVQAVNNILKSSVLNEKQLFALKDLVKNLKEKCAVRLKAFGMRDSLKKIEGAIVQAEIKIANDDEGANNI